MDPVGGMRAGTPSTLKLWRLTDETVLFPGSDAADPGCVAGGAGRSRRHGHGHKLPEDPTKAYITLGILVAAAGMFFTEIVPLPITALRCRWRFP